MVNYLPRLIRLPVRVYLTVVQDVIVGKIYFLLVRIKIKHMEIAIIKRETCGIGPNTYHENENIAKYVWFEQGCILSPKNIFASPFPK